jgi:hypothetical protein
MFFDLKLYEQLTMEDIKKYNGKNVVIKKFLNILMHPNLFVVCVYFSSINGLEMFKLKCFLRTQQVYFLKNKKKNSLISLNHRKNFLLSDKIQTLFNISGLFLIFFSYAHFLHFQKNVNSFIFKNKLSILFFKINNQLLLYNSSFFSKISIILEKFELSCKSINSFFFFSFRFIICYFSFLLFFFIQFKFFSVLKIS